MAAAIGERTEFMVHAKSTAPGKSWPPSPATPYPFQCSAQMSVNSRREVSRSAEGAERAFATRAVHRGCCVDIVQQGGGDCGAVWGIARRAVVFGLWGLAVRVAVRTSVCYTAL